MDIVERYLSAIERELPTAEAADIKAELRDVLLSRIEEQEERLGRPLTRPELDALLIDFGHPLVVAGRYRKVQYLIGPDVFPFWWTALKTTLSVVGGIYLVLTIVAIVVEGAAPVLARVWPSLWNGLLMTFAIVTLVGVAMELYTPARILQRWKPSQLAPAGRKTRSRFEIGTEIGMGIVFVLWWTGVLHFRNLLPIPSFIEVQLGPIWSQYHWPILGYMLLEIGVNVLALARPGGVRLNQALKVLRHMIGAVILVKVLEAGHWVTVSGSEAMRPGAVEIIERNFDLGLRIGLTVTLVCMIIMAAYEAFRFLRQLRVTSPAT